MAVFKIGAQLQLFLFFLFEAAEEVLPEDISRERKEYLERHGRRIRFLQCIVKGSAILTLMYAAI